MDGADKFTNLRSITDTAIKTNQSLLNSLFSAAQLGRAD